MKSVEDQYIDTQIRENLLAELSAGTGAPEGDLIREIRPRAPLIDRRGFAPEVAASDIEIEREVRSALQRDPIVPFERMASHVHQGWVTLEGRVDHAYEKKEAEEVVLDLEDVRGIVDHVTVGLDGSGHSAE